MQHSNNPTFLFFFAAIAVTLVAPAAFACGGYGTAPTGHVVVAKTMGPAHHSRRAHRQTAKRQRLIKKRAKAQRYQQRHQQRHWQRAQMIRNDQLAKRYNHHRRLRMYPQARVMQQEWQRPVRKHRTERRNRHNGNNPR